MMVIPIPVSWAIMRYSEPRKSSLNSGASDSSNPDKESITRRLACILLTIVIRSFRVSSIDKSSERVLITPTCPLSIIPASLVFSNWLGLFSKAAITPVSPRRTPSARNSVVNIVLPEPDGPTSNRAYPCGKPPPSISSSSGTPTETRCWAREIFSFDSAVSAGSTARGKTRMPSPPIRRVCKPGAWA